MRIGTLGPILVLSMLAAGCASTVEQTPQVDPARLSAVAEAATAQNEVAAAAGYYKELARHWTENQLPKRGNCHMISLASVFYLQIEADGRVSEVYGDPENRRVRCYRAAYTNRIVPKPPVSPFYFRMDMR